jgi:hypothetical protein
MTVDAGLSKAMGDWLRKYAGVNPEVEVVNPSGYLDADRLADAKGNTLAVITNPPNQGDPATPYQNVHVGLTNIAKADTAFLFEPARHENGRTVTGPTPIQAPAVILPSLTSHATILTAHNHSPLLATDSPEAVASDSKATVTVTVFNPSPLHLSATLTLKVPAGWSAVPTAVVKIPAFGHSNFKLTATSGQADKRAVLKAVLLSTNLRVDSVPFDVEVR